MQEKDFQSKFTRWVKDNWVENSAFELKFVDLTKHKSMPYSAIKPHQLMALKLACSPVNKLVYKIPDMGISQKPFDCFCLHKASAFLVVMFWERGVDKFYMIAYNDIVREIRVSDRKSLTLSRLKEIGQVYNF